MPQFVIDRVTPAIRRVTFANPPFNLVPPRPPAPAWPGGRPGSRAHPPGSQCCPRTPEYEGSIWSRFTLRIRDERELAGPERS